MRFCGAALGVSILLVFGAAAIGASPNTGDPTDLADQDINNAVQSQLVLDRSVPSHRLSVKTQDGIVTVSGSVPNLLAKDRTVERARTVKGVRSVIDRVEVEPVFRSDRALRGHVMAALLADPATEAHEVDVTVRDAVVTLTGTVQSWAERDLCLEVAKGVWGVRAVEPDFRIEFPEVRTDSEIQTEIIRRLESDVFVDDGLIEAEVLDGKVTLSGAVGSAAERERARRDVRVMGVREVDVSDLDVEWWARESMTRTDRFAGRSDAELEKAVEDAFVYDPRVSSFDVYVDADNGTVTLTGVVNHLEAKRSAGADARNTVGVWRVKNLIAVRTTQIFPDDQLASDVREALDRDPYVTRANITVAVINGRAFLNGTVGSLFEKNRAESLASRVLGVGDVDNGLMTTQVPVLSRSDWEIRREIEDQLYWSPFVDSEQVEVTVDGGVATLTGEVDTWREYTAAANNALEGGARRVDNNLTVDYGPPAMRPLL